MAEPDNLVLQVLREVREDVRNLGADLRSEMTSMHADLRSEMASLRADVASDIANLSAEMAKGDKRINEQLVFLRRSVMEYHSTAVGHGLLYSELEERVRRIEQRLDVAQSEPH